MNISHETSGYKQNSSTSIDYFKGFEYENYSNRNENDDSTKSKYKFKYIKR